MAEYPPDPIADECEGGALLYSSGTTGKPKGIVRPLSLAPMGESLDALTAFFDWCGFVDGSVYLSPAPLYHAAPIAWSMAIQRRGGTVVLMERFDAEQALALIERYSVTCGQFVPTMFVRMLKLPKETRESYDLSSLRSVVHAAAPCPVDVKQQMMDWWGPIIYEYYSSTEGAGASVRSSRRSGSRTRARSASRSPAPRTSSTTTATSCPVGEAGTLWFEGPLGFEYRNDPAKTAEAVNALGYKTVGDIGYVDEEGYLYLTDRKAHMIISGGVNIYPQETENVLVTHPKVFDVAVIGVPDDDLGEQVKAVVQPVDWSRRRPRARSRAHRVLPGEHRALQVPAHRRLRARAPAPRHRQALQGRTARPLLADLASEDDDTGGPSRHMARCFVVSGHGSWVAIRVRRRLYVHVLNVSTRSLSINTSKPWNSTR